MRVFLLSLSMVLAGVQVPPQANQNLITGRVARLGGTEAVAGVDVALTGPFVGSAMNAVISNPLMAAEIAEASSVPQRPTTTDSDGRFNFTGLAPGLYTVIAQHQGYFGSATSGAAATSGMVTSTVTVVNGQQTPQIQLSMVRGGMISGQVRDPNGQPASGLTVAAYQVTYRDGRAGLSPGISKTTDDRGEYRILWLSPGEYYVAVTPPRPDTIARASDRYAKTFYPGSTEARSATRLLVGDGAELIGTNIGIRPAGVKVTGRVITTLIGPNGQPSTPSPNFYLLPADPSVLGDFSSYAVANLIGNRFSGEFELRGIPPGRYDLIATAADSRGRQTPGRTRIVVAGQDLENVSLTIRPGVDVKVRVTLEGAVIPAAVQPSASATQQAAVPPAGVPGFALAFAGSSATATGLAASTAAPGMRISLQTREDFSFTAPVVVNGDASGAFIFSNVPEARYAIQVSGLPANAYVDDVRENGIGVSEAGFQVADQPASSPIEVSLRSNGSTIRGTVRDGDKKAVVSANVVLVPQPGRRQNTSLYKVTLSNRDGTFTLTAVPPGEYKLFAWYRVPPTAYLNAEFLARFEAQGQSITVGANGNLDQQLTAILDE